MRGQEAKSHHIGKVRFILQTDEGWAAEIQQRCSTLFHQQLRAKLSDVLSQYGSMRIDTLSLKVGQIAWPMFDTYLQERVLQQLTLQLSTLAAIAKTMKTEPTQIPASTARQKRVDFKYQQVTADNPSQPLTSVSSDASKLLSDVYLAAQFESYLQSGQFAKPRWLGADDWLLAKLQAHPITWQPVLARCSVQYRTLQRLLQAYRPDTLRHISHVLSGSTTRLAQSNQDTPAPYLTLGALCFFQRHPALVMPAADGVLQADTVQPELALWLEPLQAEPSIPILQQWLRPLFHQPPLRSQVKQSLPSLLVTTLQTLLDAPPLLPVAVPSSIPSASLDVPKPLSDAYLADQFESYLHSGQFAKPQWLGADDWLLAKLQAHPITWQPVLARCCVQYRTLQRLLQVYSPDTLRHISHVLSGSTTRLAQSNQDTPAPYLTLGALRFFQRNPALVMPKADGVLQADTVQPELALWLEPLQAEPSTPILQQWLRPLFHQPPLRSQVKQSLPRPLVTKLQSLLEAPPLLPIAVPTSTPPVSLDVSKPLSDAYLADQFESYLHSGQFGKPQWLGADDWLLAKLQAHPVTWQPVLARGCVQYRTLRRLLQVYSPDTLRHISHVLSGSTTRLAQSNQDTPAPYLILGALRFFQRNPALVMPKADGVLQADTVQPELALWLELLQAGPSTPILQQWLRPLFHQPPLRSQVKQSLPSLLVTTLQTLLDAPPLLPVAVPSSIPSASLDVPKPLSDAYLADQFESYLHSGQFAKPQWLGADDWLLAKLQAHLITWQPVLARCCVQYRTLKRLLQVYSPDTLRHISHVLSGSSTRLAQSNQDTPAPYLTLGALRFFQRNPALVMPKADGVLQADTVQPELALWLELLQAEPSTPILQQWLRPLFHQPQLCSQVKQYLSSPMVTTLQSLLEAIPLAPLQAKSTVRAAPAPAPIPATSSDAVLAVSNAGLVLLWPMLRGFLTHLGLVQDNAFINHTAQLNAVYCLDWLIWNDDVNHYDRTLLTRYLCGLSLDTPLDAWRNPSAEHKKIMKEWLNALPVQLPGLHRCGVDDLRQLFLQRSGSLFQKKSKWILDVEPHGSDILLGQLPWPVNSIVLPWLTGPLTVNWPMQSML